MPHIRTDYPVKALPGIYVTKSGYNPRFGMLALGSAGAAAGVVMMLALPVVVLAATLGWTVGWGKARTLRGAAYTAGVVLLPAAVLGWRTVIWPAPWPVAIIAGIGVGIWAARKVAPHIRYETPIGHWAAIALAEFRSRPTTKD